MGCKASILPAKPEARPQQLPPTCALLDLQTKGHGHHTFPVLEYGAWSPVLSLLSVLADARSPQGGCCPDSIHPVPRPVLC